MKRNKKEFILREEYTKDSSAVFIANLINEYFNNILRSKDPYYTEMLENEIQKKFEALDMRFKFYHISDGRIKVKVPKQIAKRNKLEVLIELFRYFYGKDLNKELTIREIYSEWIESFKSTYVDNGHRSSLTYERYTQDWDRFYADSDIASEKITTLKASAIKAFYAQISANEALTRRSLNNAKTILNKVYDYAIDKDYVSTNVARSVSTSDLICKEEDNEDLVYSDYERKLIMKQAMTDDDTFARAIFLMFSLCIRVGELKSLRWSDVDWNDKTIYIHSQIVRQKDKDGHEYFEYKNRTKGKKKEANRFQPLSYDAYTLLKKQKSDNPTGEYIFMYRDKPLITNTINHHLMRICEKVGVQYMSTHKIRFWSVVNMSKKLNPVQVQHLAGHLDPATTDHYRKRVSKVCGVDPDTWNSLYNID